MKMIRLGVITPTQHILDQSKTFIVAGVPD